MPIDLTCNNGRGSIDVRVKDRGEKGSLRSTVRGDGRGIMLSMNT